MAPIFINKVNKVNVKCKQLVGHDLLLSADFALEFQLNNLAKVPDQYHRVGDDKMNKLLSSFFAHFMSLLAAANASFFSVMGSNVA